MRGVGLFHIVLDFLTERYIYWQSVTQLYRTTVGVEESSPSVLHLRDEAMP